MSGIDWDVVTGAHDIPLRARVGGVFADTSQAGVGIDWNLLEGRGQSFSKAQIAAALAAIPLLEGKKSDANKVPTLWEMPKKMPTITDVDFRDMSTTSINIASLFASNKWLKRERLIWHVQHPGEPLNPSVFTTSPIVLQTKDGNIILDGQHRLAALTLLGATKWPVFLLPSRI